LEHDHFTHGHHPHDEVARVPLIIKPAKESEKQVQNGAVSLVDVVPTILRACDITDSTNIMQGEALAPVGKSDSSTPVFTETAMRSILPSYYSVRTDEWKYIRIDQPERNVKTILETIKYGYRAAKQVYGQSIVDTLKNPMYFLNRYRNSEDEFLYHITEDPKEEKNLVQVENKHKNDLNNLINQWKRECKELSNSIQEDDRNDSIDSGTNEQLRQLGYVD
jgi:arylsulfatase A-like enzyme